MQAVFDQLIFPLQRIDPVLLVLLVLYLCESVWKKEHTCVDDCSPRY